MPWSRPEQHGTGDGAGAEPVAHVVERGVERAAPAVERQRELARVAVLEAGERRSRPA